ncbi:LHFPL tetraspan subfamily member 3 protein [Penaeus vannamei]|uniref:LHFPL tetraspan subfamily member 3 protein n=1 Tax=Penaeus vannamei TaxID=6689 RepID=UPI00387FADF4
MKRMEKGVEYLDQSQLYTTHYIRNSKAIGVLWGVFTICFAIINIVVFVQPQWIGDTLDSKRTAALLLVGVVVFPTGWEAGEVREVCGPTARPFNVGACEVRWAYILAIIGVLDAVVLSALAFVLATRHVRLQPEPEPVYGGSVYKGQMNPGFVSDGGSLAGSRKSLNLQPVMLMPHPDHDRFSEFSHHTGRSKASAYRAHYASSVQNFQL